MKLGALDKSALIRQRLLVVLDRRDRGILRDGSAPNRRRLAAAEAGVQLAAAESRWPRGRRLGLLVADAPSTRRGGRIFLFGKLGLSGVVAHLRLALVTEIELEVLALVLSFGILCDAGGPWPCRGGSG